MKKVFYLLLLWACPLAAQMKTTVESDEASYDGNEIHLSGSVVIHNLMGRVKAKGALLKRDPEVVCKVDFPYLELTEGVEAILTDGSFLECEKVIFDYLRMKSDFISKDEIHYSHHDGEIFAREGVIDYVECGEKIEPVKITLKGNVRMIHKEPTLQYALADVVEYFPQEERLILTAKPSERVLFFDLTKGMQLSAPCIKAQRGISGKEQVQGVGDVSFIFREEELNQLKERFEWK